MDTCTDCGAPATCEYDYGTGPRKACAGHDPLRPLIAATVRVPSYYRTLDFPIASTVTVPWDSGYVNPGSGWVNPGSVTIMPGCACTRFGPTTSPCPVHQLVAPVMVIC